MLSEDLSMLSFMMLLFSKMVEYLWSYTEMKFDVVFDSCSIYDMYSVLLKIIAGFMLLVACWVFVCIQLRFLGKFCWARFGDDEHCICCPENPRFLHALPRRWYSRAHGTVGPCWPIALFRSNILNVVVLLSGGLIYKFATRGMCPIELNCHFSFYFLFLNSNFENS